MCSNASPKRADTEDVSLRPDRAGCPPVATLGYRVHFCAGVNKFVITHRLLTQDALPQTRCRSMLHHLFFAFLLDIHR